MNFFAPCLLNPKPSNVAVGVLKTGSIDGVSLAWSDFHPRECRAARVRARALVSGVRARPRADHARIVTPIVAIAARIRLGPLPLLRPSFDLRVAHVSRADVRTKHLISSSQPVRGPSATFARQTNIEDPAPGTTFMSQPLLRRRADSLSGTSSHQELIGNPPETHEHHTRLRGVASQDFEPEESDDNGSAAAGLDSNDNQHVHDGQNRIANLPDFQRASSPAFVWGKEVRGEVSYRR